MILLVGFKDEFGVGDESERVGLSDCEVWMLALPIGKVSTMLVRLKIEFGDGDESEGVCDVG